MPKIFEYIKGFITDTYNKVLYAFQSFKDRPRSKINRKKQKSISNNNVDSGDISVVKVKIKKVTVKSKDKNEN